MKYNARLALALAILSIFSLTTVAATAAVKKPAKRIVLGTTQLNGDQAQIGVTYTLGKRSPINVTLDKVEYTVEPVKIGNGAVSCKIDQKLMVLHYTLHNPNPRDYSLGWGTLNITAVDANDTNWRYNTDVGIEATGESCNMKLKPAQKAKVYVSITVPAKGEMPKVIFESSDKLVLRYDLRGKVKPLPAPIADPSDPSGATALEKVPAQVGVYYPIYALHAKIDSAAFVGDTFKGRAPRKGNRFLAIMGTIKNNLPHKQGMSWHVFDPKLLDADGAEIKWNGNTLYSSRDDNLNMNLEPGQELRFRYIFEVPVNVKPQSLSIRQGVEGRLFVYDVSSVN